jgi:hypothetical protein
MFSMGGHDSDFTRDLGHFAREAYRQFHRTKNIRRITKVTRPVALLDRRVAVLPGIAPAIMTGPARRQVRAVQVRPAVAAIQSRASILATATI